MEQFQAFTYAPRRKVDRLITTVHVFSSINEGNNPPPMNRWEALWDTGATNTCISSNVARSMGLIPIGAIQTSTANGLRVANTYCVNIVLPNNVLAENFVVSEVDLKGCDLLIGMDVIKHGDFSITNKDSQTVFFFRLPSINHIDYVQEYNSELSRYEIAMQEVAPTLIDEN